MPAAASETWRVPRPDAWRGWNAISSPPAGNSRPGEGKSRKMKLLAAAVSANPRCVPQAPHPGAYPSRNRAQLVREIIDHLGGLGALAEAALFFEIEGRLRRRAPMRTTNSEGLVAVRAGQKRCELLSGIASRNQGRAARRNSRKADHERLPTTDRLPQPVCIRGLTKRRQ